MKPYFFFGCDIIIIITNTGKVQGPQMDSEALDRMVLLDVTN